jgi:cytochrome c oxidase cbb3-type subunit 3
MRLNKKSLLAASTLLVSPLVSIAAETAATTNAGKYNAVLIGLVCLVLVLVFVIGMLANTLSQLGLVLKEKNRKERNSSATVKSILLLIIASAFSFPAFAAEATEAANEIAAPVSNYIQGIPKTDFYVIMSVIAFELVIIFTLAIYVKLLIQVISAKPETAAAAKAIVKKTLFWDRFNKSVTIEKERDILLDHDYDGIQELDNSLPPWWKYGFYLTIVVSFIYIYRFHISHDGPSQHDEFVAAMQKGEEDKAAYLAKAGSNVDENTVTFLSDAGDVAQGKDIFIKACAACHLADGGGIVGPNLTDPYWLHGGSIKDIFKSIKYGWQDKGMKSWKDDFSPKQLQQIASYVKSLKGTKPATAKAPQGDLYTEGETTPKGDTTQNSAISPTKNGRVAVK